MSLIKVSNSIYYTGEYIFLVRGLSNVTSWILEIPNYVGLNDDPSQFGPVYNSGKTPGFEIAAIPKTSNFEIYYNTTSGIGDWILVPETIDGQFFTTASNELGGGLSVSNDWIPATPAPYPKNITLAPDASSITSGTGATFDFSFTAPDTLSLTVNATGEGYAPNDTLIFTQAQFLAGGINTAADAFGVSAYVGVSDLAIYGFPGAGSSAPSNFRYTVTNGYIQFKNGNQISVPSGQTWGIKTKLKNV